MDLNDNVNSCNTYFKFLSNHFNNKSSIITIKSINQRFQREVRKFAWTLLRFIVHICSAAFKMIDSLVNIHRVHTALSVLNQHSRRFCSRSTTRNLMSERCSSEVQPSSELVMTENFEVMLIETNRTSDQS